MALLLLAILIAPLPLMLVMAGFGMFFTERPDRTTIPVRYALPRRNRYPSR